MGAGSKVQLRGNPGNNDDETYVTGHALWVLLAGMASSSAVINVKIVASDVEGIPNFISGGSGDGKPIEITNVGFTTLHTVPADSRDQIRLYFSNVTDVDVVVVMRVGGASGDEVSVFSPAQETVPALDDHLMEEGMVIDARLPGGSLAGVMVYGDVNRFVAP